MFKRSIGTAMAVLVAVAGLTGMALPAQADDAPGAPLPEQTAPVLAEPATLPDPAPAAEPEPVAETAPDPAAGADPAAPASLAAPDAVAAPIIEPTPAIEPAAAPGPVAEPELAATSAPRTAVILGSLASAAGGNGKDNDNGNGDKVFVCKYVGTPGEDERLQTGNNPISVSVNAIPDYQGVGSYFADAQGRSYVLAEDIGQPEPDVSECPGLPVLPGRVWVTPTLTVTQPVCTPTATDQVITPGAVTEPSTPHITYTISGDSWTGLVPGDYTVTARANFLFWLGRPLPSGWEPSGWRFPHLELILIEATYQVTIVKPADCAPAPAWVTTTLAVTQPVCTPTDTDQVITPGAIEHPWNDGVDYTITGSSWTDLEPGTYTVTATARDGWYLSNQPDGWTPQEDGSLTYPVTIVKPADCAPAPAWVTTTLAVTQPVCTPTDTDQVITPGAIEHPWNDGVDYTITGSSWTDLEPGTYTVTATARDGWYLSNQPDGWTPQEDGSLTYPVTIVKPADCAPAPAWVTTTLTVTQPVCTPTATGQTVTTGAIEHPWNDGVDYTITGSSWTGLVPGTYTVTATARDGWYLSNQPDGWTPQEDGSLTYPVTIVKPADCAPAPAWVTTTLTVTQPVCTPTATGQTVTTGAIEHPWNDGVDYTITGSSWTGLVPGTYTVTATARDGWYLMNQPDGWTPQEDGSLTYPVTIVKPADCAPAPVTPTTTPTSQVLAQGTPPTYTSQVLAAGTPPTRALASTGADVAPYALAGLLTLLAGTGLFLLKRRSDSSDTQDTLS